jgi:hypothetical protein
MGGSCCFTLEEKVIILLKTESKAEPSVKKSSSTLSFSESNFVKANEKTKYLLPDANMTIIAPTSNLRNILEIKSGLDIVFSKPPGLNINLGDINFTARLNGSTIAHCLVRGINLFDDATSCRIDIIIKLPLLSSTKGVAVGVFNSITNGILLEEWDMLLEISDLTVCNDQGLFNRN